MEEIYSKLILIYFACLCFISFIHAVVETIKEPYLEDGKINYLKTFMVNFLGRSLLTAGATGIPAMLLTFCCIAGYSVFFWHCLGEHDNYTGSGTIICYDIREVPSYERFYGHFHKRQNIHYYACIKSENDERHIVEISPKTYKQSKIFDNIETKNGVETAFVPPIDKDENYYLKNDPAATNTSININSCSGGTCGKGGFNGVRGPSIDGVMRMRINGLKGY